MNKQTENAKCFYMAVGMMLGVIITALSFAVADHKKTYNVVIEKPIAATIQTKHWAMDSLK